MVSSNVIGRALAGSASGAVLFSQFFWPRCNSAPGYSQTVRVWRWRSFILPILPVRWMALRPAKVFGRPAAFVYKNKDK